MIGAQDAKLDTKVVEPLTDAELVALLKACSGLDPLRDRRDEAIIRFMFETGGRQVKSPALGVDDIDLATGTAIVRRGKGGKGRTAPFGPQTGRAIDRYMRLRRGHRLASTPDLWLGDRGKPFDYDGLHKALGPRQDGRHRRFHPHRLRHTAAHRWLAAGGSEGGLMAVAGWTRPDMLLRYTKAQASARAGEEARRLNLAICERASKPQAGEDPMRSMQAARRLHGQHCRGLGRERRPFEHHQDVDCVPQGHTRV